MVQYLIVMICFCARRMQMANIHSIPDEVLLIILRQAIDAYYNHKSPTPIPGSLLAVCARFRRVLVTGATRLTIVDEMQLRKEPYDGMRLHLRICRSNSCPFRVDPAGPYRNAVKYLPLITGLSFDRAYNHTIMDTLRRVTAMTQLTRVTLVNRRDYPAHERSPVGRRLQELAASSTLRHLKVTVSGYMSLVTSRPLSALTTLTYLELTLGEIDGNLIDSLEPLRACRIKLKADRSHVGSRLTRLVGLRSLNILSRVCSESFAAAVSLPSLTSLSLADHGNLGGWKPALSTALVSMELLIVPATSPACQYLLNTHYLQMTQLTSLVLSSGVPAVDLVVVSHLTRLQNLMLMAGPDDDSDSDQEDGAFWGLSANVLTVVTNLTSLTRLSLGGIPGTPTGGVMQLQHLTALQRLSLTGCDHVAGWDLAYLSRMRSLSRLELVSCLALSDYALQPLSLLPSLVDLELGYAPLVTGNGLKILTSLTCLRLDLCESVLSADCEHLTRLRRATFQDMPHFTRLGPEIELERDGEYYVWEALADW